MRRRCPLWGVGRLVLIASVLVFPAGCATIQPPLQLDPMFAQRGIRSIALLPIVDRRKDRSAALDVEYEVGVRARKALEKKGYQMLEAAGPASGDAIGMARLLDADLNYLVSLNPPDADAVIAIYVDDSLSSYKVLSYAFKVEALGVMVSKRLNAELWRAKGIGNAGQGGLISGVLQGLNRSEAWDACVYGMLSSIPKAATSYDAGHSTIPTSREVAMDVAIEAVRADLQAEPLPDTEAPTESPAQ